MRISPAVKKETTRIACVVAGLCAIMIGVFTIAGALCPAVLLGTLLGGGFAVLNFFFMGIGVQSATGMSESKAKLRMQVSYMLRNLCMLGVGIIGLAVPAFHWLATLLPLLFPRIAIVILQLSGVYKRDAAAVVPQTEGGEEE